MGNIIQSLAGNAEAARIIDLALAEDCVSNDVTSLLVIPEGLQATATLLAKAQGVLAGIEVFEDVFYHVDETLNVDVRMSTETCSSRATWPPW